VKRTAELRSIWNVEALVSVNPTYMTLVARMSHRAGSAQTIFGKEWRRRFFGLRRTLRAW